MQQLLSSWGEQDVDYSSWFGRLNFILSNHPHHAGELLTDAGDKKQVKQLLDVVLQEDERNQSGADFIIQTTLVAILGIVSRSIQQQLLAGKTFSDNRFAELLHFISIHLTDPERITIKYLSGQFNIAPTYFSEYFSRNAGESFQDFVMQSRLNLAASRALYTHTPILQIALELGFTDSSHLNRMMKKYKGKGMRAIRQNTSSSLRDTVL